MNCIISLVWSSGHLTLYNQAQNDIFMSTCVNTRDVNYTFLWYCQYAISIPAFRVSSIPISMQNWYSYEVNIEQRRKSLGVHGVLATPDFGQWCVGEVNGRKRKQLKPPVPEKDLCLSYGNFGNRYRYCLFQYLRRQTIKRLAYTDYGDVFVSFNHQKSIPILPVFIHVEFSESWIVIALIQ